MKKLLIVCLGLIVVGTAVHGAIMRQNKPFDESPLLIFDQFDPSLGTLQGIWVGWTGVTTSGGSVGADNDGAESADVELQVALLTVANSGSVTLGEGVDPVSTRFLHATVVSTTLAPNDGDDEGYDENGEDWAELLGVEHTIGGEFPNSYTDGRGMSLSSDVLADYVGLGTFEVGIEVTSFSGGTTSANGVYFSTPVDPTQTGDYTVVYEYTETDIPEPSSLALLGLLAVAGLGLRRRR